MKLFKKKDKTKFDFNAGTEQTAKPKKKSKKKKIIVIVVIAAVAVGAGLYIHHRNVIKAEANADVQTYSALEQTDVLKEIKTSGKIQSTMSKNITAAADGKIMKVYAKEGDEVTKGQTLAVLDTSAIQKQLTAAKKTRSSDLASAKSERDTAKNDYAIAKLNYSVGDISKQDLLKAKNSYITASTTYREKLNDDSSISTLEDQLANCTIKATASGTITSANATVGSTSSGSLFTIEKPHSLKIVVSINEYDINSVKVGQKAVIKTEMTNDDEFNGVVTSVAPAATKNSDGSTATSGKAEFKVQIKVKNPSDEIKIGGNARASIIMGGKRNVLAVTTDSLSTDKNGKDIVFTYKKSGSKYYARAIKVTTGVSNDLYTQVSGSGLSEGMDILNNASSLKDGQEINLGSK